MSRWNERVEIVLCLEETSGLSGSSSSKDSFKIKTCLWDSVQETREVQLDPSGRIHFAEDISWRVKLSSLASLIRRGTLISVTLYKNGLQIGSLFIDLKDALPSEISRTDFIRRRWQVSPLMDAKKGPTSDDNPSIKWLLTIEELPKLSESTMVQSPIAAGENIWLDKENGYFIVGSTCTHVFQFGIQIFFASHLDMVVEKETTWNSSMGRDHNNMYYLSYEFLGETIRTQTFTNLREPELDVEEAIFRIKSSHLDLIKYLSEFPPMSISVCLSGHVLAKCIISIQDILKPELVSLRQKSALSGCQIKQCQNCPDAVMGVLMTLKVIKFPVKTIVDWLKTWTEVGAEQCTELSTTSAPSSEIQEVTSFAGRFQESISAPSSEIQESGGDSMNQSILRNSTNELPSVELSERETTSDGSSSSLYATARENSESND